MNFVWRNATKEDCLEFNKWGELAFVQGQNEQVKQGAYNINRYLNADRYGGLGVIVRQYIGSEEFPDKYFFAKTATVDDQIVGMTVVYKHENENVLECMAIAVNPNLHGKGYGTAMIFDIVKEQKKLFNVEEECEITAHIDKSNIASQTAFAKAGFVKTLATYKKFVGLTPVNEKFKMRPTQKVVETQNTDIKNNDDFVK
ncbi:MAG: GNAT family N-acetyltransferase [Clostridia bacterium]|nr:GNAT family N-acetyltransferase [Clostridia bacterium]